MKKYILNEIKGKYQGEVIIVEAENGEEACQKAGMEEIIKCGEKLKTMYVGKIYECYELGKPYAVECVAHRK